jgi:hypothetical protein
MNTGFLLTGLILLLLANILMVYATYYPTSEGFQTYFLENAGGSKDSYIPIGPFDGVRLKPENPASTFRYTKPDEPLIGPEVVPGPDNLFVFKNNQSKPECCSASYSSDMGCVCTTPSQRKYINERGGNRTAEETF